MKRCLLVVVPLALLAGILWLSASLGQSPSDDLVVQAAQAPPDLVPAAQVSASRRP